MTNMSNKLNKKSSGLPGGATGIFNKITLLLTIPTIFPTLVNGFSTPTNVRGVGQPIFRSNDPFVLHSSTSAGQETVFTGDAEEGYFFSMASNPSELKSSYDAVVVGSGYGAGCAALRYSELYNTKTGKRFEIAVLERGKERLPGQFPEKPVEVFKELQLTYGDKNQITTNPRGLYDLRVYKDVMVFQANGLGGTSLINANVVIEPDERVYEIDTWPEELRNEWHNGGMEKYQTLVRNELGANVYPDSWPRLTKLETLKYTTMISDQSTPLRDDANEQAAKRGVPLMENLTWKKTPIAVSFDKREHDSGLVQPPCNLCGNCVSGCNSGAKNTVNYNYIGKAWARGAQIFCEMKVTHLDYDEENKEYLVYYERADDEKDRKKWAEGRKDQRFIRAKSVFLGAGSLGTTEILLRSREHLSLSDKLGDGYSGNGDSLGAGLGTTRRIDTFGMSPTEESKPNFNNAPGPCITSVTQLKTKLEKKQTGQIETQNLVDAEFVVEDCVIPHALQIPLEPYFKVETWVKRFEELHDSGKDWKNVENKLHRTKKNKENPKHTMGYLVMSHDDGQTQGKMKVENDKFFIDWPNASNLPNYKHAQKILDFLSDNLDAKANLGNPVIDDLNRAISVHPLGGSCMGNDASEGVVNHRGQVFKRNDDKLGSKQIYPGLYCMDGSVVPQSLGINPLLTITSIAERSMDHLVQELQNEMPEIVRVTDVVRSKPKPGVSNTDSESFTERMAGTIDGEHPIDFLLTVTIPSVKELQRNPATPGYLSGTVECSHFSDDPLSVNTGIFRLFALDPNRIAARRMEYEFDMVTTSGKEYTFKGHKEVQKDFKNVWIEDMLKDTTTLFVTITDKTTSTQHTGRMKIKPFDFMKQLTTLKGGRFPRFADTFAREILKIYTRQKAGGPDAPKPLPVNPWPEQTSFLYSVESGTSDAKLKLPIIKFSASAGSPKRKHPLILVHGMGVDTRIYTTPTIDKNLMQCLCEAGYDVYLPELRASIAVPEYSSKDWTIQQIQQYDVKAFVEAVKDHARTEKVMMLGHCMGGCAVGMNLLLDSETRESIHAVAFSQMAFISNQKGFEVLKRRFHIADVAIFLEHLGQFNSDPSDPKGNNVLLRKIIDLVVSFYVKKDQCCSNKSCHMITFIYGLLYQHEQLNHATHEGLGGLFGYTSLKTLKTLVNLMNRGFNVDTRAEFDNGIQAVVQEGIPVHIVHGKENQCYEYSGSEQSFKYLRDEATRVGKDPEKYSFKLVDHYGHMDCIFGKNAHEDVFPSFAEFFNSYDDVLLN